MPRQCLKTKWPVVVLTDRVSLFSQVRYTPSFKLYTTYILIFHYTSHPKKRVAWFISMVFAVVLTMLDWSLLAWAEFFCIATTTKRRFSYLTCLRINLLFHPRTQQQKHEKATEHIALLANGHLNDSLFIIVCKIPTASSDTRFFFKITSSIS